MSAQLEIELPRTLEAPGLARAAVAEFEALDPAIVPDVRLLVSELITNSVKYGPEGPVRLGVFASPKKVRAEIVDQGVGFVLRARDRKHDDVGGWGLHLVEELANRWGAHEGSTHVWFEIDLDLR